MIIELSERSKQIFRQIVDTYVETGEPIGSRTIARRPDQHLSPATIRNVMADLEDAGLLFAPHTSAGRVPTDLGFRLYVDGLLESGHLNEEDRALHRQPRRRDRAQPGDDPRRCEQRARRDCRATPAWCLRPRSSVRSSRSSSSRSAPGRALVVMVADNGMVENRFIDVPVGIGASALVEAGNYLTARLAGRSLAEARKQIEREIGERKSEARQPDQQGGRGRPRDCGATTRPPTKAC